MRTTFPSLLFALCILAPHRASLAQTPTARAHHALAYDERRGRIVLHGGSTALGNGHVCFDDYREWDGTRWSPARATGVRLSGHALFFDAAGGRLLLAAGMNERGMRGATYRWSDGGWTEIAADSTLAAADVASAYDRHRRRAVLYGGIMSGNRPVAFTWELDGDRWTRLDAPGPGPLASAGMAYDPVRRHVLLYGGNNGAAMSGETWSWDGTTWRRLATTGPSPRALAQMAFDRRRGVMVLFGGRIRYPQDSDETWEWDGTSWRRVGGAASSGTP